MRNSHVHHSQKMRFERGTRYYLLLLEKDLLDDWVITRVNGRISSSLGHSKKEVFIAYRDAMVRYKELAWYRQVRRGYRLQ